MVSSLKEKLAADGFCVLEGFLTGTETDELRNEANELVKSMPEQGKRTIFSTVETSKKQLRDDYFLDSAGTIGYFYEEGAIGTDGELLVPAEISLNKIGHALHSLNPTFRKYSFDERVKETCYQLGFEAPAIVQSMYIFKNPGIGGVVTPHQDGTYLHTEPMKVVGFWIALEDATVENGCLKFIRGSHRGGLHRRMIRNGVTESKERLTYTAPPQIYQTNSFECVPVKKGSCIVIDGQVVHSSEANTSKRSRHVYTFHVIESKGTTYSKDNWLQTDEPFLNVYEN